MPRYHQSAGTAQTVFVQPVSSFPSMKRVAVATPVPMLSEVLLQLEKQQVTVERVFDSK
ncbi:hypothetical protein [Chitinophaga ginsengisegetis]|uniref:hypothetical protein n=1 Tax=Chitinophaga ginsengisegetis TaxID=393003 RepID=UPI001455C47F|nr:hypothetical protein [Chitinophaga ginsengisegetis]MDR6569407.1 hypothetical protein [Chitinophaga ginsengisegetis]MDR6648562.1 hypothetical protein [Chitinophaga ginsengisegetis]MDR6655490.1 hypothetical protein [Chitinophaga ginsengisegetis]